ncbi:hypothetical protein DFQ30_002385 [Apophysomyces sp. BC1015]|nr:hypothetical protein DFQ30_002385 [Apophysomyces sp. BC1015]
MIGGGDEAAADDPVVSELLDENLVLRDEREDDKDLVEGLFQKMSKRSNPTLHIRTLHHPPLHFPDRSPMRRQSKPNIPYSLLKEANKSS